MAFNIQGFFDVLDHGHLRSFLDQRVRDVRVAKPSIEEPDAIELARPDLWGGWGRQRPRSTRPLCASMIRSMQWIVRGGAGEREVFFDIWSGIGSVVDSLGL